ncbi:hypothetical protein J2847_004147 [Azospirillum agricola]|uniref:hypothetical protein n=1 Tax=Azospirillum agricola TaxID=1720247 RepID=UPI001AE4358A|nr:hypothetical protein [Azospirillum agricola]MBP2230838.1 hypothetical protein [Azospirillum agricola]
MNTPELAPERQESEQDDLTNAQQFEIFKARLQCEVESHKAFEQHALLGRQMRNNRRLEMWKQKLNVRQIHERAQIDFGLSALRGLFVANGGGIVALIAFMGHIWSKDPSGHQIISKLYPAINIFSLGVTLSIVASGLSYITQALFNDFKGRRALGNFFRFCALGAGLLAIACFPLGVFFAANAIR